MKQKCLVFLVGLWLTTTAWCPGAGDVDPYPQGVTHYYSGQYEAARSDFLAAVQHDPSEPMAHLMLSRTYRHLNHPDKAFAESELAVRDIKAASDEEQYLINSWGWRMRSEQAGDKDPQEANKDQEKAIWNADFGIAIYPDSFDLYVLRGDLTVTAIRQVPYYLAALRLDPSSPLQQSWKKPHIAFPTITCGPGTVAPKLKQVPRLFTGLGEVHLKITGTPLAQKYFTQGLCCLYAYVTPDAVKSFQYAAQLDPHCCMAYWGLSLGCTGGAGPMTAVQAAEKAWNLARRYGTQKEKWYCACRVLQVQPGHGQEFVDALAGAIEAYPDDADLWVWRGTIQGFAGETPNTEIVTAGMPFILAAWHVQPDHPSANHELIHAYEGINRPLLGWRYSWGFRRSAPHMPHAQHMQAHLAMRLGRWDEALSCTRLSVQLSREGYPELDKEHHREVYLWALAHEGCFREARTVHVQTNADLVVVRMSRLEINPKELADWSRRRIKGNFIDGWYGQALADLEMGNLPGAEAALPHLKRPQPTFYGVYPETFATEIRGRLALQHKQYQQGIKTLELLARQQDLLQYSCRWGQGAYYDEIWGEAALQAGQLDRAKEAFQEAVAHEHGSVMGALGLQVVAELRKRPMMAASFAQQAREDWKHADPGCLNRLLKRMRAIGAGRANIL